jgi:hypothetical protein
VLLWRIREDTIAAAAVASTGGGGVMKYVGFAVKALGIVIGLLFLLISLPAAPIIIYLTILFNVIKLMWGRLKEL